MRVQALAPRYGDLAVRFSLVWTTSVSFLLLLTRDPPDPGLFVPVLVAALPLAAAPRHRAAVRILAAALLASFLVFRAADTGTILLAPAVAALLLSAFAVSRGEARDGNRRVRRMKRVRRG